MFLICPKSNSLQKRGEMNIPVFSLHLRKPPKHFPRLPVQRLPARVWQSYLDTLKTNIIAPWRDATQRLIIDRLPHIERQVETERPGGMRKDAWPDELSKQLSELSDEYDTISKRSQEIAAGAFESVNGISHRQWYDIAKRVLGVDLFQFEPWIANESKAFVHENVGLITKLQETTQADISRIVMGGFREGKRWETLRDEIMGSTDLGPGVFDKVETRAELVARDQCGKLYGDLAEKRQTSAGLDLYVWRSLEDERVVGTPGGRWPNPTRGHGNHYLMDGKVCKWNDPSVYADTVEDALAGKWKQRTEQMPKGKPGFEYQCRCYGEPVFQTLFEKPGRRDSLQVFSDPRKDAAHGWFGFDIDGTLAKYDFGKQGQPQPIGEPVPAMASRLRKAVASGRICKYFTARAETPEGMQAVRDWAVKYGLPNLDVTNVKDHHMILCYDDRARQVVPNTGEVVGD